MTPCFTCPHIQSLYMLLLIPAGPHSHLLFSCFCCKQLGNVFPTVSGGTSDCQLSFSPLVPFHGFTSSFPVASHISLNSHSCSVSSARPAPARHQGLSTQGTLSLQQSTTTFVSINPCTLTSQVCSAQRTGTQASSLTFQTHAEGQPFSPYCQP